MKVKHPTLPGVSKNVPDEIVEKWLSNGWTPIEEKAAPAKKAASRKPSPEK